MKNKINLTTLNELEDNKLYGVEYLMAALNAVGLPSSIDTIKDYEKLGVLKMGPYLLPSNKRRSRRYSGAYIKDFAIKRFNEVSRQ